MEDEGLLERICEQCPECDGSGLTPILDEEGVDYVACDYCYGHQCWDTRTRDYFDGECNENCGYNREQLKADWLKF